MVTVILLLGLAVSASAFIDTFFDVVNNCTANEFACRNSNCVPYSSRCNENNDCGDGSDEEACGKQFFSRSQLFLLEYIFYFVFHFIKKKN